MFAAHKVPITSRLIYRPTNEVIQPRRNNLSSLLDSSHNRASYKPKPQKMAQPQQDGVRPDIRIGGDQSVPVSIMSCSQSKPIDQTNQENSEDIDDTMIEMSIDEHSLSKP